MSTISVASNVTLGATTSVLASKREHVTTVATPIGTHVGERLETVRNAMIYLLLITLLQRCMNEERDL